MFKLTPQFFDVFGLITFTYIIVLATLALKEIKLPQWMFVVLLLIGIAGLIIDGWIVYKFYLKK